MREDRPIRGDVGEKGTGARRRRGSRAGKPSGGGSTRDGRGAHEPSLPATRGVVGEGVRVWGLGDDERQRSTVGAMGPP